MSNLFSFVSLTTFCYVIACFLCFPIHHPDTYYRLSCICFVSLYNSCYSTTIQQSTSCHVMLQCQYASLMSHNSLLQNSCNTMGPRTQYLPFYGRLLALSFPCKENIDLWGLTVLQWFCNLLPAMLQSALYPVWFPLFPQMYNNPLPVHNYVSPQLHTTIYTLLLTGHVTACQHGCFPIQQSTSCLSCTCIYVCIYSIIPVWLPYTTF